MKRILVTLFFLSQSFSCFAGTTASFNVPDCMAITKGNLIACFQNKTDHHLNDYQMKETLIYEDGSFEENIAGLGGMQPGHFTVVTTSSLELQKNKISSIWFSIIKGNIFQYKALPGCNAEFTPTSISKSMLTIFEVNGNLYCK